MDIEQLLESEKLHLQHLHDLVEQSIQEEQLLSAKLIQLEVDQKMTFGQKMADAIASFGGSWTFILLFLFLMFVWITINVWALFFKPFDPFPFILLNLVLSCIAAMQAPVIMMSQNRQEDKDRRRSRNDFLINLKAELEIRNLNGKVDLMIVEQMKTLFDLQKVQIDLLKDIHAKTFRS